MSSKGILGSRSLSLIVPFRTFATSLSSADQQPSMEKLVIIGSGPAAHTAAIYASRALIQPLLFEGRL